MREGGRDDFEEQAEDQFDEIKHFSSVMIFEECDEIKKPTCQYCLADPRYTRLAENKDRRCPVCGSDYTGPRRSKEYAVLRNAGLIRNDD